MKPSRRTIDETAEEFVAREGVIQKCPPSPAHDLLDWGTLPEHILGASYDDLADLTSAWYLPSTTRQAVREAQTSVEEFLDAEDRE